MRIPVKASVPVLWAVPLLNCRVFESKIEPPNQFMLFLAVVLAGFQTYKAKFAVLAALIPNVSIILTSVAV